MFQAEVVTAFVALALSVLVIFNEHGFDLWKQLPHKLTFRFSALITQVQVI